jgi:L-fuconate dehydratase
MPPQLPGYSIEMHAASLDKYGFPAGEAWRA